MRGKMKTKILYVLMFLFIAANVMAGDLWKIMYQSKKDSLLRLASPTGLDSNMIGFINDSAGLGHNTIVIKDKKKNYYYCALESLNVTFDTATILGKLNTPGGTSTLDTITGDTLDYAKGNIATLYVDNLKGGLAGVVDSAADAAKLGGYAGTSYDLLSRSDRATGIDTASWSVLDSVQGAYFGANGKRGYLKITDAGNNEYVYLSAMRYAEGVWDTSRLNLTYEAKLISTGNVSITSSGANVVILAKVTLKDTSSGDIDLRSGGNTGAACDTFTIGGNDGGPGLLVVDTGFGVWRGIVKGVADSAQTCDTASHALQVTLADSAVGARGAGLADSCKGGSKRADRADTAVTFSGFALSYFPGLSLNNKFTGKDTLSNLTYFQDTCFVSDDVGIIGVRGNSRASFCDMAARYMAAVHNDTLHELNIQVEAETGTDGDSTVLWLPDANALSNIVIGATCLITRITGGDTLIVSVASGASIVDTCVTYNHWKTGKIYGYLLLRAISNGSWLVVATFGGTFYN